LIFKKKNIINTISAIFCLCTLILVCANAASQRWGDSVTKLECISVVDGTEYSHRIIYAWDNLVLEKRLKESIVKVGKTDSIGIMNFTDSLHNVSLAGYFLVDLNNGNYYTFNESDSLISIDHTEKKKEGIDYNWDLVKETNSSIQDFHSIDTVIDGVKHFKLVRTKLVDNIADTYSVLIKQQTPHSRFQPVSAELSERFGGMIIQFQILDGKTGKHFQQNWKTQIPDSQELEKVKYFQKWLLNYNKIR